MIILILTKKKRYSTVFDIDGKFSFNKNNDIWDVSVLIKRVNALPINKLKAINGFLQLELNNKYGSIVLSEASEAETIIDLIEFISSHKKKYIRRDVLIDPEYKIYKRFRDFADKLITQYTTLYGVYGCALNEIDNTYEHDEAQDLITMLYLQDISIQYLDAIELVYNQFKAQLGSVVVKSLNDVVGFKNKVEEFQRVLINQKARELEKQIADISEQIRLLDEQYAEKIRIIDKKGVLKNFKTGLHIYEEKKKLLHTRFLFEQYEQYDKQKKQLDIRKAQELLEIDAEIEDLSEELKTFTVTILNIHDRQKLDKMLFSNPERINYYERYQKIIDDYNSEQDRATIEKTFMDLMDLANKMNEEEQRYAREGFTSDEELSFYDMLFREDLSKNDIKKIKEVSATLLHKIREKISELDQ